MGESSGDRLRLAAAEAGLKSMARWIRWLPVALVSTLATCAAFPAAAAAHGPIAPVATSYLARISHAPGGLDAIVVDGDLRMWLRAPANETVIVLDYRGAPYLRFSAAGVAVNHNSAMYYLNQTPFPETPPTSLGPHTPPHWELATSGHSYEWHDGRLHALAAVALSPATSGISFVGHWRIPVLVNGHLTAITGGLWHSDNPSIVWFWPIAVLLLCVLAAWRIKRPELDRWTARALGTGALAAIAVAAVGRELHGRPMVTVLQLIEMAILLAFVVVAFARIVRGRAGYFSYFVIAILALWEGAELLPTLLSGFVLIATPAFLTRAATVVALGAGVGLVLLVFRLADWRNRLHTRGPQVREDRSQHQAPEREEGDAWELA